MMRTSTSAISLLLIAGFSLADEQAPERLDLDEALARQSASDLISAAAEAYDCSMAQRSLRKLGTKEQPIYMIEVAIDGPECDEAMLLLARHGSTRDFVFRAWQPPPDIQGMDPPDAPLGNPISPEDSTEPQ